jgi:dTDP-glucose 4,6-dehydratase
LHDLGESFVETTSYDDRLPYSASNASYYHFVRAYYNTYGLPIVVSNCSFNYGLNHFPEKLIPLMINNIKNGKPLPVYGKEENVRDWLSVIDHAKAIDNIFHNRKNGDTYNIGGNNEWINLDLVLLLCDLMDENQGNPVRKSRELITYVADRAGHNLRYSLMLAN